MKAEEDLRAGEEVFRHAFDLSPIGAAILSMDYGFRRVNPSLCRITGYSEAELKSFSLHDITHPDELDTDLAALRALACGEIDQYQADRRYIRKDASIVWVTLHMRVVRDGSARPLYFLPMIEDISERKRAIETLKASEERYRVLADHVADAVAVLQAGCFMFINAAFLAMFGYSGASEALGRNLFELVSLELQEELKAIQRALLQGEPSEKTVQGQCVGKDGRKFWIEAHFNPIRWEDEPALLATMRDITELRQRELTLRSEAESIRQENLRLKTSLSDRYRLGAIIGKSSAMQSVYQLILDAGATPHNVIITGESGTGKELVARAIHDASDRARREFIPVNCGAISESLFESEFFGHAKGAFTGAHAGKIGYFGSADSGTLFLDEVGEIGLNMQVKLLRAIETGEYTPVGETRAMKADVRIIAATNRNLEQMVSQGLMRKDFFFRINVIPIYLPPLRERKEDIPLLVEHFLRLYDPKRAITLPGKVIDALQEHDWPGNVRELQSTIYRYLTLKRLDIHCIGEAAEPERELLGRESVAVRLEGREAGMELDPATRLPVRPAAEGKQAEPATSEGSGGLHQATRDLERAMILKVLKENRWNRSKAARELGISRRTLYRKIQELSIS